MLDLRQSSIPMLPMLGRLRLQARLEMLELGILPPLL
jgi:hypothetical protein